jgi:VirE N-terminal domain.
MITNFKTNTTGSGSLPPVFSVFNPGYRNKSGKVVLQCTPYRDATLTEVWQYIRGPQAKRATDALRAEPDEERQRTMKALTLKYCTPFGTFSYRNANSLKRPSGMMVADFDHIDDSAGLLRLRDALIHDSRYETDLLFISPRGHGLKWFIHAGDMGGMCLADYFRRVSKYVQFEYGYVLDESGKDIPRPCYLSHDPDCYINPRYLQER